MKCSWVVYILCCSDGKYYTGVTNSIEKRVNAHNAGEASKFTRSRLPVKLLATSRFMAKEDTFRLEYGIKKLRRNKKLQALREWGEPRIS
jgi:putative endonuclease